MTQQLDEMEQTMQETDAFLQERGKGFFKLENDGESAIIKVLGGWGKVVYPSFRKGASKDEKGDTPYYEYELLADFSGQEFNEEAAVRATWNTTKTNYERLTPLLRAKHRLFEIQRHGKRNYNKTYYEINALD
jgi:hypothetical protein